MSLTVLVVNKTGGDLPLDDLTVFDSKIPASGETNLSDYNSIGEIRRSKQLLDHINAGDAVLKGNGLELTQAQSQFAMSEGVNIVDLVVVRDLVGSTPTSAGQRGWAPAPPANSQAKVLTGGGTFELANAQFVTYDNTTSGLVATDVQAALDELDASIGAGKILMVTFEGAGPYAVGTQIGGRRYNRTGGPLTITDVTMHREVAGTSGSSTVDLNIDGVTVYTTQANRPTVAFGEGADAVDQGLALPDVVAVPDGSYLSLDIDSVEGGSPQNLTVVVTATY